MGERNGGERGVHTCNACTRAICSSQRLTRAVADYEAGTDWIRFSMQSTSQEPKQESTPLLIRFLLMQNNS